MPTTTIPAIERELDLRATPERVWQALTDDEELGSWFGHRARLDLRPGGLGWFEWEGHGRFPVRIDRLEPPTRLVWSWGDIGDLELTGHANQVEWRLEPLPSGGTRLHLRETGFVDEAARWRNTEGWLTELAQLAVHLASEAWEAGIRRRYTLTSAPDRVWRAFADPDGFRAWFGGDDPVPFQVGHEGWFAWPEQGRFAMVYERIEPTRYVAWRWVTEPETPVAEAREVLRTEWVLVPRDDGGTEPHLFESGFPEEHYHRMNREGRGG